MKTRTEFLTVAILGQLILAGCGDGGTTPETPDAKSLFSKDVTELIIEVDYQEGAEPFTGSAATIDDLWGLFRANAQALFKQTPRTITVPSTLGDMEKITDITAEDFTSNDIVALADKHRNKTNAGAVYTFYVIFLDGYYKDSEGRRDNVLGVSLGSTGIIAMFKPVIGTSATSKFVEQTTLIHEFGHAVGLVNNGISMVTTHQDSENGRHCTNNSCVMYWANEGLVDLIEFAKKFITSSSVVVFGDECLNDAAAAVN
jgi:predicted Zn-dependent protease